MEFKVYGVGGGSMTLSDVVFDRPYNEALIHQLITSFRSNARSATSKQKDRQEVSHSTKKPWKQKGTGRARAGMTSSPIWRGGGRIFPNSPEQNYTHKINKKMYRGGMCVILSQLVRTGRLSVIDDFSLDTHRTKNFLAMVGSFFSTSTLLVAEGFDENLFLASRNLKHFLVEDVDHLDPVILIKFDKVVFFRSAIKQIEEKYS